MSTVRLLVADDSETIRRAVCALLEAQTGIFVCGEAQNYPELLKMLSVSHADVVLMDIRMPGQKLFDSATIKRHLKNSCMLAMSVWHDVETVGLAETYGAVRLLDKGELATTLIPAIEDCIQRNRRTPPHE